jgi:hypothetical protein
VAKECATTQRGIDIVGSTVSQTKRRDIVEDITIWYKFNHKKGEYEFNHFVYGIVELEAPTTIVTAQKEAWKGAKWEKHYGTIDENFVVRENREA